MNVESHFNILLEKYDLRFLYKKFICLSVCTTTVRESFYWLLLYFTELVKVKPELIKHMAVFLILTISLHVPLERYYLNIKAQLLKEIKLANSNYFNDRIIKMSKKDLLTFDLVDYFNVLDHFNENLEQYILNIKTKYDIPIRIITLIIIGLNKQYSMIIGLFFVFYMIVRSLNENKLVKENELTKQYFEYESIVRNYIINSKNFLINDEFNQEYLTENLNNYEKINKDIAELNNKMDTKINIAMVAYILIVIGNRIKELNQYDFFYYFLVIYDVEYIADKVTEYYKNKIYYNKMQERLKYLNGFIPEENRKLIKIEPIIKFTIENVENKRPKLMINKPLVFEKGQHYLIDGESGSGKTSLLYLLKGILKPTELKTTPSIDIINSQTYLTLPNHKSLYSGNLYDIISNYEKTPNTELIDSSLELAKISHILGENKFVNIEKLSGGERIRLLVTRIIYTVKTKNYNILLFDEIDENLNDQIAFEICQNLRSIFSDKILLYITHNDKVKTLFENRIMVKNGLIV